MSGSRAFTVAQAHGEGPRVHAFLHYFITLVCGFIIQEEMFR